jgi:hypothetical protein
MLDDEPKPTASEFVDFTYYGEVTLAGLERPRATSRSHVS